MRQSINRRVTRAILAQDIVEPGYDTNAHAFLLGGDRGAAAVLGASALTEATAGEKLGRLVVQRITAPGVRSIGQAVLDAKRELAQMDPGLKDVLLTWSVLGDPAVVVVEP